MNILKTSKVKERFHKEGIQITTGSLMILQAEIDREVARWVIRTKEGNVKRLTESLIYIALGRKQ